MHMYRSLSGGGEEIEPQSQKSNIQVERCSSLRHPMDGVTGNFGRRLAEYKESFGDDGELKGEVRL